MKDIRFEDLPIGRAFARREDPDTSHQAAKEMTRDRLSHLQLAVVQALRQLGNSGTSEEVEIITGINHQTITPRFRPLADRGVLRDTGERKVGRSGRKRIVWALNDPWRESDEQFA